MPTRELGQTNIEFQLVSTEMLCSNFDSHDPIKASLEHQENKALTYESEQIVRVTETLAFERLSLLSYSPHAGSLSICAWVFGNDAPVEEPFFFGPQGMFSK